jgi:quinol monooxygenase YgiN
MIVVHAAYDVKPGFREKVIELAEACVRNTRLEAGNISYVLLKGTEDETTLMCVEEWKDEEAFQAHLKMPHYLTFAAERAPYFNSPALVKRFDATRI